MRSLINETGHKANLARAAIAVGCLCVVVAWQLMPMRTNIRLQIPTVADMSTTRQQTLIPAAGESIAAFRQERTDLRRVATMELDALMEKPDISKEVVERAQLMRLEDMSSQRMEVLLEGLLRAKGFTDVLATVDIGAVNIILRSDEITQVEAAMIMDVVTRETGKSAGEVKIIPVK